MKWVFPISLFLLVSAGVVPVQAAPTPTETPVNSSSSTDPGFSGIGEKLGELIEELQEFTGEWDATLADVLKAVFFLPFLTLAQQLVNAFTHILLNTPSVYPNPGVEEVHQDVLLLAYLVSGLIFIAAGLLHMVGPVLGVAYRDVRMILPRLFAGLVFATISLPLLQYAVEFSDALVMAFRPTGLQMEYWQYVAVQDAVIIAWFINAVLLLAVVLILLIRDVYILFVAAIAPILAVMWSVPKARRYADTFIGGFWAALLIAPADALVLKFVFSLTSVSGTGFSQHISNWVIGATSLVLMILIPHQLWGSSQSAVGLAYGAVSGVKGRIGEHRTRQYREQLLENTAEKREFYRRLNDRLWRNEEKRQTSPTERDWEDFEDDDSALREYHGFDEDDEVPWDVDGSSSGGGGS